MNTPGNFLNGTRYLMEGMKLLNHPKLRLFVLVPILVNTFLFIILTTILIRQFGDMLDWFMEWLPNWLDFLAWVIGVLVALFVVLIYGYSFSMITNVLAAPFYGYLAEKTEQLTTGRTLDGESLLAMIPRTVVRELRKLWYFLWRSLLILILTFIPLIGPLIGLLWGAWSMSIQYSDYAADNHQTPFGALRDRLGSRRGSALGFGGMVMLGMMVPVLNIFIMPAAVIGGTLFWVRELE
ncbi:sulfate transporter CysZ [Gilvimarinus sp. F26214L]|uniref:sulfate transporter CysZ n=1 Tax=Gilvimarinus sp. DZF01 TaxID=3461371 RepID=UPI0040465215